MNCQSKDMMIGISPCPNDTYIFHALLKGLVRVEGLDGMNISCQFADVQKLNEGALAGKLHVTKLSVGAVPAVLDKYVLLSSGAALGWGCGPLVVARRANIDIRQAKIAIPGRHTTASLLLDLHGGFGGQRVEMLFSDIMPAIIAGEVDMGVIIHEGRFTYARHGLAKLLDLGEWWEQNCNMPLPLGVIACRRDLAPEVTGAMEKGITESLLYARRHPEASADFVRKHAQELDDRVTAAHIATFVTDYSVDLGNTGRDAITWLVRAALERDGRKLDQDIFFQ